MKSSLLLSAATLLVLALATPSAAFDEVHLNEITEDARAWSETRLGDLDGLSGLTKTQKKERKTLKRLLKRLGKTSSRLSHDFRELKAAAGAQKKLLKAGVPIEPALDAAFGAAFTGAERHLSERRDYVDAHLTLITSLGARNSITKLLDKARKARDDADLQVDVPTKRAKFLAKAERFLTRALKKAEKTALRDTGNVPPVRFRSGDLIGQAGGVVAIPSDDPSNIAGFSVEIPAGQLSMPTAIRLEEAPSFVSGEDLPAGNAVRVRPETLIFTGSVKVRVRFLLPPDSNAARLALFQQRGLSVEAGLGGTIDGDFLTLGVNEFGVFQAGVQAPPAGTPDGRYKVHALMLVTAGDTESATVLQTASVTAQDFIFNPTLLGSRQIGPRQFLTRQLVDTSPNHVEVTAAGFSGSVDFAWERIADGRFRFSYNEGASVVDVEGVTSDDGAVIAFTGRGEDIEVIAFGVRQPTDILTAADVDGRWAAVELGVSLRGGTGTPFGTRYTNAFRLFDANGVDSWTYDSGGTLFHTDITYNTNSAGAEHTSAVTETADGGTEMFAVQFTGQVNSDNDLDGNPRRSGWVDTTHGVFVSSHADLAAESVSVMLALRQPGGAQVGTFDGLYHFARLGIDVTTNVPENQMSAHAIVPAVGTFDVQGAATMTPEDAESSRYEITGTPPLNAMAWGVVRTLTAIGSSSTQVDLNPDANGNHRPVSDDWWYGIGEVGTIVIGMTPAAAGQLRRGIFIGIK